MKRIASILLVGVMMFSLFGCSKAETNTKKHTTKQEKEIELKEDKYITYGEASDSGYWNIKVKSVTEVSEVDKKDGEKFTADGKFINILLDMKNISNDPISYSTTDFKLKDIDTGKMYNMEDIGYEVAHEVISEEKFYKKNDQYITIMDDVNPDKSKITCVSFEMSKDVKLDSLALINQNEGNIDEGVQFKLK